MTSTTPKITQPRISIGAHCRVPLSALANSTARVPPHLITVLFLPFQKRGSDRASSHLLVCCVSKERMYENSK